MAAAAMPEAKEKKTAKGLWTGTLKKAMEYDTWGQSLEAIEEYEKLIKLMDAHQRELQTLSVDEKTVLQLTIACAKLRCVNLHDVHGKAGLKAADLKPIPDVLELMFSGKPLPPFPVQLADMPQVHAQPVDDDAKHRAAAGAGAGAGAAVKSSAANAAAAAAGDPDLDASVAATGDDTKEVGGTLLPKKAYRPGTTSMSIYLDRVGLKDAETYFEPRVTVTVVNELGQVVGDPQDTPNSKRKKPQAVLFGHTIHIQPSWEEMVAGKLTVFFEFKHFKFQKKKVSTRCFALMETREIKSPEQTLNLELYKKPTDWTKKKLSLFTIKPLYCTVTVHLQKH